MRKFLVKILVVLCAVALLAGCATPAAPEEPTGNGGPGGTGDEQADRYGGDFVLATDLVCSIVDPHHSKGLMASYQWMQHILETPLAYSATGEVFPLICDYELSEDGLTLALTIIPGRYFHDGTEITIDDVIASIERVGRVYPSFRECFTDLVVSQEVTDDSVTFVFSEYRPNTILQLADSRGPMWVLPKKLLDEWGDEPIQDPFLFVGSGPYVLEKYEPDREIVVRKWQDYKPVMNEGAIGEAAPRYGYFDSITWSVNLDATSRTAGLLAGDYHFGSVLTDMQQQAIDAGLKVFYLQNEWAPAIFFNLDESNSDSPVFDKNFRKAIRAALDMEAIMLSIRDGDSNAFILDPDPVSRNSVYHNDIIKNTEWNIADKELARRYLEASNYNGETIYWLCSQSASFYKAAVVGIEQLREVGINVEMMLVDPGAHSSMRIDPATGHDIGAWETQKTTLPISQGSFVRGDQGGWWKNEERDRLLRIMNTTVAGSEESLAAYEEFCRLAAEEVPWIIFGELLTPRFGVPELELNYQGTNAYYWNSYFAK